MAQVNERALTRNFPTPDLRDVLFYTVHDEDIPKNQQRAYGQTMADLGIKHPDALRFPNHQLVAITLRAEDRKYQWWWAARREDQDLYNWEQTHADIAGQQFDAIARTYIVHRDDYDSENPAMGSPMPDKPESMFGTGVVIGDESVIEDYVLAGRKELRAPEKELDALFVFEQRIYVKRCNIAKIDADDQLGVGVGQTTTLYYRGEQIDVSEGSDPESLVPVEQLFEDPEHVYWGSKDDGTTIRGEQLSCDWFAIIVESSRDTALEAYKLSLPTITNLTLPDVLQGVSITWNEGGGNGEFNSEWGGQAKWEGAIQTSLSGSESASAEGSYSIQPEISLNIRQPLGRNIPSTSYFFYMKVVDGTLDSAAFLAKVGTLINSGSPPTVNFWPSFNPVAHNIVLKGMKVAVSAKASASASMSAKENEPLRPDETEGDRTTAFIHRDANYGKGKSYDVSTSTTVVRIPPTIHGLINFTGDDTTKSGTVSATCDVGWPEGTTTPPGITLLGIPVTIPQALASETATLPYSASVTPTSLSATTPSSIPSSGYYVVDSKISPYEAGWVSCFAEVINAADI